MDANHPTDPPFLTRRGDRTVPFVLTCEHARPDLPDGTRAGADDRKILRSHWGWDIGAWALTHATARLLGSGATAGRWSRLWIDLNRAAGDPTLVRREAQGHVLSWNRALGPREIERRYSRVHAPYHQEVDREIAHRLLRGVRPVLLAIHTFTPSWRGRKRGFEAGVLYDRHGGPARHLARALRRIGLEVRYNEPYSGRHGLMYSIDRHGREHGLVCLELEINQALFDRRDATVRLAAAVASALTEIEAISGRRAPDRR